MTDHGTGQCPVCGTSLRAPVQSVPSKVDTSQYDCRRCGKFGLTFQGRQYIEAWILKANQRERKTATFAHALRKMQIGQEVPLLDTDVVDLVIKQAHLPTLEEQADSLIRWIGPTASPGESVDISYIEHGAIFGVHSLQGFQFLIKGLNESGILQATLADGGHAMAMLTFRGWQRYEALRHGAPSGRKAFMALQYGDSRLDRIVRDHFRPGVEETGFSLTRLDDDPRAGLIDDRLRVEIQGARFVIADLTHGNHGAYWEAGYGEGLGKPVIYTCEESVFKVASHFDTSHHWHILWKEDDLAGAVARLKATIRATIPEAKRDNA